MADGNISQDQKQSLGVFERRGPSSIAYQKLSVFGHVRRHDYQKTFGNYPLAIIEACLSVWSQRGIRRVDILRDFEGLIKRGELVVVLGRPGSGCSTFLKALAGYTNGLEIAADAQVNYEGQHPH